MAISFCKKVNKNSTEIVGYSHDTGATLLCHKLGYHTYSTVIFKTLENNNQNSAINSLAIWCYKNNYNSLNNFF